MKNIVFILICFLIIFACSKEKERFPDTAQDVFTFECLPKNDVVADGNTLIEFVATLKDPTAPISEANNIVEFKSFAGKFLNTVDTITSTTFNRQGIATAFLKVGVDTGYFACIASVGMDKQFTLSDTIRLIGKTDEPSTSPTILINPQTNPVEADGYSLLNIDVEVTDGSTFNAISLSSTEGTFVNLDSSNNLFLNGEGKGQAILRVGTKPGNYLITGSLSNSISKTEPVNIGRSYSDFMILTPSSSKIKPINGLITITSELKKNDPLLSVSDDAKVEFRAFYEDDEPINFLSQEIVFTGTNGIATVDFKTETPADTTRLIIIEARTLMFPPSDYIIEKDTIIATDW